MHPCSNCANSTIPVTLLSLYWHSQVVAIWAVIYKFWEQLTAAKRNEMEWSQVDPAFLKIIRNLIDHQLNSDIMAPFVLITRKKYCKQICHNWKCRRFLRTKTLLSADIPNTILEVSKQQQDSPGARKLRSLEMTTKKEQWYETADEGG